LGEARQELTTLTFSQRQLVYSSSVAMTIRTILLLSLWAQGMAQEVQSAGDDEDMKQLVEMLSDDKVLDQVVDKLTDRLSQNVDLSAMMDETTLAKAAAKAAPPPKKAATKKAQAPPKKEGGSLLDSFAQAWQNLDYGGVAPTNNRNTGTRGTYEYQKRKALPERMSQGAFAGPKPMARIGGARPVSNMRAPFMLDEEPTDSDSVNVFAVLALSFFAGVAITLAVHKFRQGPSKDSTLQGYAPLHD